jgi:hypothetical protein
MVPVRFEGGQVAGDGKVVLDGVGMMDGVADLAGSGIAEVEDVAKHVGESSGTWPFASLHQT